MDDYEAFVRASAPSLTRFTYVLCGHAHTTEDLMQTALLKVHKAWDRVREMEAQEGYVRKVIVNEYLSWRRKKSSSEVPVEVAESPRTASGADPLDQIAETDAMWRELSKLPRKQRATLVLRYYLDYSDDRIAEFLDCSNGTVRSHISRGLETLRAAALLTQSGGAGR